ncbi:MAG: fibronectin type III domain-containing protein [Bacteroidales bacterium]|nr:fibronectin type III domain-containing protein [Bacteroidales bacterium]
MKKHLQILALIAAFCMPWMGYAQTLDEYGFATGTDASKWITVPTSITSMISANAGDYGVSTVRSLGFSFPFAEGSYTQFSVNADGNLCLGSTVTGTSYYSNPFSSTNANYNNPKINMLGCDGYVSSNHYVRYLHTADTNGDSLGVVEFCVGTYTSSTRENLYKWQVHLYHNGTIEVVFGTAPAAGPDVTQQRGLCTGASDGWFIDGSHAATHFTNGTSATIASGVWPTNGRYYTFTLPNYSCPKPIRATVSNLTYESFDISWTDTSDATSWLVRFDSAGVVGLVNEVYDTTMSFTGLTQNTPYAVNIAGLCSNGDTSAWRIVSLRTPCSYFTIPYTEAFESYGTGTAAFPTCWYRKGSTADRPYVHATTTYGHNNTHGLYFYAASGGYCYAIMPPTNHSIDSLQVSFWARQYSTSYNCSFAVGVMTDPDDISTFVAVDTVHPATTTYEQFDVSLSRYTGTGKYIAFSSIMNSGSGNYLMLDDVTVDYLPTCPHVENLRATYVGTDTIILAWNSGSMESSWMVSDGTNEYEIYDSTYIFDQLNPNTSYTFTVRAVCGYDDTSRAATLTVRTSCGDLRVPFSEDFESYGTGTTAFPTCWFKKGSTADRPYIQASTSYGHNNTHGLYFYAASGGYCYAILPRTSHAIDSLQVSFWACQYSTSYNCSFAVGVMTDPNDISTFVAVDTVHPNSTTYENFEVMLNRYTGTGKYIAFSSIMNTSSGNYLLLDDVTVEYIPTCPRTSPINVDSVGLDYIALRWSENGEASQWVIEYDTVDFVPGAGLGNIIDAYDTTYMITGLDSATTYYFYLHADCGGGDTSFNNFLSVATLAASPATVPYTCDFEEDGPNGWDFLNGNQVNAWYVGTATNHGGTRSMYVSNNNGTSNNYSTSDISYTYAKRTINFSDTGEYAYSYDWKGQGESHYYDFSRAFIVPASYQFEAGVNPAGSTNAFASWVAPAGWSEITEDFGSPVTLAQSTSWRTATGTFYISNPGTYNIVFAWANDASGGTNPATAIDNVSIVQNLCPSPQNFTLVNGTNPDSIQVSWTASSNAAEYIIAPVASGGTPDTLTTPIIVIDDNNAIFSLEPGNLYDIYMRIVCMSGDSSLWVGPLTCAPGSHIMRHTGSDTLRTCRAVIYDEGGATGQYTDDADAYLVIYPTGDSLLRFSGWAYTESTYDYLYIYDGVGTSGTLLFETSSSSVRDDIPMTVSNGPITLHFTSDGSNVYDGFELRVSCVGLPNCPNPTNFHLVSSAIDTVAVAWTDTAFSTNWQVGYGLTGLDPDTLTDNIIDVTSTTAYLTNLSPSNTYDLYVRTDCGTEYSWWIGPVTVTPGSIDMPATGNSSVTACSLTVFDDGGSMGQYTNNANSTLTIYPSSEDSIIRFSGWAYTESSIDYLRIYDGVGTSGTLLWQTGSSSARDVIPSTLSTEGPITLMWHTDGSVVYDGFELNISCAAAPQCRVIRNLRAENVAGTSARILWNLSNAGGAVSYFEVETYQGSTLVSSDTTSRTACWVTGLRPGVNYSVSVRGVCAEGGYNSTETVSFHTNCLAGGDLEIGGGSSSNSFYPTNIGSAYSYTQELYTASQLGGAMTISGVSYYVNGSLPTRNISLYLGETAQSAFSSYSDYVRDSLMHLVYTGTISSSAAGWVTIYFDSIFHYSGVGNLCIGFDDNTGSTSSVTWRTRSGSYQAIHFHNSSNINPASPSGSTQLNTTVQNDIRFLAECDTTATCVAPNLIYTDIAPTQIDIEWVAGLNETSWEVAHRAASTSSWTIDVASTSATTYSITGLSPNTTYQIRVTPDCGGDSIAAGIIATTDCGYLTALPFVENFETAATGSSSTGSAFVNCWTRLNNGTSYGGYPYISSSSTYNHTPGGSKGMYWYNTTTTGTYGDYECVVLPAVDTNIFPIDSLQLSFWAKASSSSYSPVFYVGVMTDPADVNTFQPFDTIYINGNTNWELFEVPFAGFTGYGQNIAVLATRPASSWYAYLDDFTIDRIPTCLAVRNVHATGASETTIDVDWTDYSPATAWQIEYGLAGFVPGSAAGSIINVYSHPTTITGLDTLTNYDVYVRPVCAGNDTGRWSQPATLSTASCADAQITTTGSPASSGTSYYVPLNNFYNYSLTETIIDSAELNGAQDISILSYYYNYSTPSVSKSNCTIYFQPTNKTAFTSSSDIVALNPATAVRVYTGPINCTQGWNHFALDTVYSYDGNGGILVIVDDNSGDYDGSAYIFKTESCSDYKSISYYSDSENPDVTSVSSFSGNKGYYQYRVVMQLTSCNAVSCRQPVITGNTHNYEMVTINWVGNGTNYEVAYKESAATAWSIETPVAGNSYTFTGLQPATNYDFRVRQDCTLDSNGFSDWAQVTILTDSLPCLAPQSLAVTDVTNATATFAWTARGYETAWDIHVWFAGGLDTTYTVTTNPATVSGFTAGVTYNAAIRALCGTAHNIEGEYGDTITFTTQVCPNVTGLSFSNVTPNSVTLSWTADPMAESWVIEYGYSGFSQGRGTTATSANSSYVINGLEEDTPYDFYVRAVCGTDWTSEGWASTSATTAEGGVTCDAPTNVTAVVAGNAATINWNAGEGNISFEIEYGVHGFSHGAGTTTTATTAPATIANLAYETNYDVYVRAVCAQNTYSAWSSLATFTTEAEPSTDCDPVQNLAATQITDNSVIVTWTPGEHGSIWEVVLTDAAGNTLDQATTEETSHQFSNLTESTDYIVKVRTKCDDDQYSSYVSVSFRTTGEEGIDDILNASCTIYPNPTSSATTISVSGVNGQVRISVVDMNGRVVTSETMECATDCAKTMDVDALAQGAYFVRITGENINMVKKLIVR